MGSEENQHKSDTARFDLSLTGCKAKAAAKSAAGAKPKKAPHIAEPCPLFKTDLLAKIADAVQYESYASWEKDSKHAKLNLSRPFSVRGNQSLVESCQKDARLSSDRQYFERHIRSVFATDGLSRGRAYPMVTDESVLAKLIAFASPEPQLQKQRRVSLSSEKPDDMADKTFRNATKLALWGLGGTSMTGLHFDDLARVALQTSGSRQVVAISLEGLEDVARAVAEPDTFLRGVDWESIVKKRGPDEAPCVVKMTLSPGDVEFTPLGWLVVEQSLNQVSMGVSAPAIIVDERAALTAQKALQDALPDERMSLLTRLSALVAK